MINKFPEIITNSVSIFTGEHLWWLWCDTKDIVYKKWKQQKKNKYIWNVT